MFGHHQEIVSHHVYPYHWLVHIIVIHSSYYPCNTIQNQQIILKATQEKSILTRMIFQ